MVRQERDGYQMELDQLLAADAMRHAEQLEEVHGLREEAMQALRAASQNEQARLCVKSV